MKPKGNLDVTVCYEGKQFQLPLLVMAGNALSSWLGSGIVKSS